jgi:lipid-A-disaccharide synthase
VTIIKNNVYDVVGVSDIVMVASGTATVETALLETPMIIVYKVSPFSYFMGRMIIDVDHIGMVNIIAGKTIVPEFIQDAASPERMADEIYNILTDSTRMERIKREQLGSPGASSRVAELAYEMMVT